MRYWIFALLATPLIFVETSQLYAVDKGDLFPDVKVAGYKSGVLDKAKLMGKVTVINFWATWCEACKVELKEMETVFAPLLKNKRFQFSFVTLDKNPQKAAQWVKENLKDSETYLGYLFKDPDFKVADELNVDSFPMTLIIDSSGKVVHALQSKRGVEAALPVPICPSHIRYFPKADQTKR